jgi:hypothetical protein
MWTSNTGWLFYQVHAHDEVKMSSRPYNVKVGEVIADMKERVESLRPELKYIAYVPLDDQMVMELNEGDEVSMVVPPNDQGHYEIWLRERAG